MKRITVFCGANSGVHPSYMKAASALGKLMAEQNIGLVYGGASVGLMGAIADAVISAGGHVIGVMPQHLVDREIAHQGLTDLRIVNTMHERKALMIELSDGFIAMPGGFGTLDEFCEVLTWSNIGLHQKPTGLLNINEYFVPLLQLFELSLKEEFIRPDQHKRVLHDTDPSCLIQKFQTHWTLSTSVRKNNFTLKTKNI